MLKNVILKDHKTSDKFTSRLIRIMTAACHSLEFQPLNQSEERKVPRGKLFAAEGYRMKENLRYFRASILIAHALKRKDS